MLDRLRKQSIYVQTLDAIKVGKPLQGWVFQDRPVCRCWRRCALT